MICIFGRCLELGYSSTVCNQLWSCRSFPSLRLAVGCRASWRLTERPRGLTVNSTTAVFRLVNHSRRINLWWLCCSTRSLEVHSLPSYGWAERGSRSGSRGKVSMRCEGVFASINCSKARWCGLWWTLLCIFNILKKIAGVYIQYPIYPSHELHQCLWSSKLWPAVLCWPSFTIAQY